MNGLVRLNEPTLWRKIQRQNFINIQELADFLDWSDEQREQVVPSPAFPLNLPQRLAAKIQKRTLDDPILRQFVPSVQELFSPSNFIKEPVEDERFRKTGCLLQKYSGRALLVVTKACAMNCRFCFRRNFDYDNRGEDYEQELALIRQDPSLKEVILSGGDPLSLSHSMLESLVERIAAISHVRRIRFHTRFPIGIPERIDSMFLQMLERWRKKIWFVIHSNHVLELDEDVLAALDKIKDLGIPLLNQTVLLRGVNDDAEALTDLCEKLVDHGILPYYLHQLDRIEGAAHYEVGIDRGRALIEAISARLSGYAVPKYVQELPGAYGKTPVC